MFDQLALVLLGIATLAAVAGVHAGNWTAMALLGSAIVSSAYCELIESGVMGFSPAMLLLIDLCAIIWIVVGWADAVGKARYGRTRDIAILLLFLPVWPLYFITGVWTSVAIDVIVSIQMLLTFPVVRLWTRIKAWAATFLDNKPLEMVRV